MSPGLAPLSAVVVELTGLDAEQVAIKALDKPLLVEGWQDLNADRPIPIAIPPIRIPDSVQKKTSGFFNAQDSVHHRKEVESTDPGIFRSEHQFKPHSGLCRLHNLFQLNPSHRTSFYSDSLLEV